MINVFGPFLAWTFASTLVMNFQDNTISEIRVKYLLNELTLSPERQQRALDEIALSDRGILKILPKYFFDKRKIASSDVKFLNSSSEVHEKYFSTRGVTVDEVVIQLFCWRSEKCFPSDDPKNLEQIKRKFGVAEAQKQRVTSDKRTRSGQ